MDNSLFLAAKEGNIQALLNLLRADPLILERVATTTSDTPLHIAAMLGHLGFIRELIKHKINATKYAQELNQDGFSAIHMASANGHHLVVRELLKVSSNELCNLKGKDGMTPLHCACIKGRVDTISLLLGIPTRAAIISEVNVRSETALHLAVKNNQFQALDIIVEWLKQKKLLEILNFKDHEGNTILHLAAARRNHQALKLLLECNNSSAVVLQVNAMNKSQLTALDIVQLLPCDSSYDDIERLLKRFGAEKGRFLNDNNLATTDCCHQNNNEVLIQLDQQSPAALSRSISRNQSGDEIISWEDYFKFRFGESDRDRVRSDLLVVAVLMATATYQACLSPPGGFSEDVLRKGEAVLASNTRAFISFMFFNSAGFFVSLNTISVLTSNYPLFWELHVAMFAMVVTYNTAMVTMSPPGYVGNIFIVISIVMPCLIPILSRMIRKLYKRGRIAYGRHRNEV